MSGQAVEAIEGLADAEGQAKDDAAAAGLASPVGRAPAADELFPQHEAFTTSFAPLPRQLTVLGVPAHRQSRELAADLEVPWDRRGEQAAT